MSALDDMEERKIYEAYTRGTTDEKARWELERSKLISVIDEKIANARTAAKFAENKRVLNELALMYDNIPERFLEGTYRLHSEWKTKIDSLRLDVS